MAKVKLTQVRSQIGQSEREIDDSPVLAGMLRKVRHLVQVEEKS